MGVRRNQAWVIAVVFVVVTAFAVGGVLVQLRDDSVATVALNFAAGYAFVLAGAIAWRRRPESRFGVLMMVAGALWFIGSYGPANVIAVPSLAASFEGFAAIAISHLALAYPDGRLAGRVERAVITFGYVAVGAVSVATLLAFNPRRDFQCQCPVAPFGVFTNPGFVNHHRELKDYLAGAVVVATVALIVKRIRRSNVTQRWLLAPLWVVAAVAGLTFLTRVTSSSLHLSDTTTTRVDQLVNVMSLLIPAAFLVGLFRMHMEVSPIGDLVLSLGKREGAEGLQPALARALRDPSVDVAYWLPERNGYFDRSGHEVALPDPTSDRAATMIERSGEPVAVIVHDRALLENPRLVEVATAATGMSLENERLQAELRAQIDEVQASRKRIIDAGDQARRKIERDLHDGAQQRLVALAISLRMSSQEAAESRDFDAGAAFDAAATELRLATQELRDLAHGIHPAILTERGLAPAVERVAERAPVPVSVDIDDERYPASVEATAYFVIVEALANVAKHAQANAVTARAERRDGVLVVEVCDDGVGGADEAGGTGMVGLRDRVGALGGRVELSSPVGHGTRLRVELPYS
jgi:signal transduction histidine kinase